MSNIPFYGAAICCIDHPEVQALVGRVHDRRIVTYGMSPQADVRIVNLTYVNAGARFDVALSGQGELIEGLTLPMTGDHNVLNAAAAISVALHLGIQPADIRGSLENFGGVNRRFTKVGEIGGVTIIDDYGHHPVEISAVLKAARQATRGRVLAVHQPHRYSRLESLFEEFCSAFNDADIVAISEVFAAGEAPIDGVGRDALVTGLKAHGHRNAVAIEGAGDIGEFVRTHARPGDMVVCLGAGTITAWANALPESLKGAA